MPDLTITLSAAHLARVKAAFGSGTTEANVEDWLKARLKERVQDSEAGIEANAKFDVVAAETW